MGGLLGSVAGFGVSVGPALLMLAAFALAIAGIRMLRAGQNRQKAVLMLVCATVFFGNVLILTL